MGFGQAEHGAIIIDGVKLRDGQRRKNTEHINQEDMLIFIHLLLIVAGNNEPYRHQRRSIEMPHEIIWPVVGAAFAGRVDGTNRPAKQTQ